MENGTAQVFGDYGKYDTIKLDKVLFIFAGAFNNETNININRLSELGIKREFLGRVAFIYEIKRLSVKNLLQIADNHPLLEKWLRFTIEEGKPREKMRDKCLSQLKEYMTKNYDDNVIGARWIPALITKFFINGYELPMEDTSGTMPNPSKYDYTLTLESDE